MELSEEVKIPPAEKYYADFLNRQMKSGIGFPNSRTRWMREDFSAGYQQAVEDLKQGKTEHFCDCVECLKAKDML